MPNYEFKCSCGKVFDEILSISDRDKKVKCQCGKEAERNKVTSSALAGFDSLGRSKK